MSDAEGNKKKPSARKKKSDAKKAPATKAPTKKAAAKRPAAKQKPELAKKPTSKPKMESKKNVLHTRICDLFGVKYPIVQTGMGWVSGVRLTAATSNAGGLGILAAATMTFGELEANIAKMKERTDKPFGVNMRADQADAEKRIDLLIDADVKVASFAQAPGKNLIKKLNAAGIVTMPTIGARRHAEKVAEWGVDAVIAQGQEGGGHTGYVPTSMLIGEVRDAVDLPMVGAGGFHSGQGLVAAMALGADGIAMGTRFLLTQESQVPDHIKAEYLKTKINGTVVTKAIDGHPQRVIRTPMIDELESASILTKFPKAARQAIQLAKITGTSIQDLIQEGIAMKQHQELSWAQLAMAANAPMLTKASMVDGKLESGILPTGQVTGCIDELPTVEQLIQRIMKEAEETLTRLGA